MSLPPVFRLAALVALGAAVVLAPFAELTRRAAGRPVLIPPSGGINLYLGNNPDFPATLGIRPGLPWEELVARPVAVTGIDDHMVLAITQSGETVDTLAALEEGREQNAFTAAIVNVVRSVLERTPPELSSDIIDRGIAVLGGGALLRNIDRLLTQETGVPCYVTQDPISRVAVGAGRALDNIHILKRSLPVP